MAIRASLALVEDVPRSGSSPAEPPNSAALAQYFSPSTSPKASVGAPSTTFPISSLISLLSCDFVSFINFIPFVVGASLLSSDFLCLLPIVYNI